MPAKQMVKSTRRVVPKTATPKKPRKKVIVQSSPPLRETAKAQLETAISTGRWLSFTVYVQDNQVRCNRSCQNFPKKDLDSILRLFAEDLNQLKAG